MTTPDRPPAFRSPLLSGLGEADTRAILDLATPQELRPGVVLFRQGELAGRMFLARTGRLKWVRTTEGGREILLHRLGPGDCFGLGSLVGGAVTYIGTAETLDATRVYMWEAGAIQAAAAAHPRLAQNALRVVLRYLKEYGDRHLALLSLTADQRLARALTHLGATSGRVLPTGVEVDITNQELGALADVGMFTVSRQLKHWEREGHLLKQRQRILLRHPEGLLAG